MKWGFITAQLILASTSFVALSIFVANGAAGMAILSGLCIALCLASAFWVNSNL